MPRRRRTALLAGAATLALGAAGAADAATYYGTVGPGSTIRLVNASGRAVSRVPAGRHRFVVQDRSSAHNFVLARGSTRLRATSVRGTGTVTWPGVRILRGGHVFFCATHARHMRGTFRGV